jgi:glutamate-1-semialdehyde 2,1-aminomutase
MTWSGLSGVAVLVLSVLAVPRVWQRWQLSRAKHRSLAGHSRMAKRLVKWIPAYAYDEAQFFAVDGAPESVQVRRRSGLNALAKSLCERSPKTLALTQSVRSGVPDVAFTGRYRVPFQFSPVVRAHLQLGGFWQASQGVELIDADGVHYLDLTGSYGVNVFGLDFYKSTMAEGARSGQQLGPVLGGYALEVAAIVPRLKAISGMDGVSFHMSGTEAVMQAVRLARYHTGRRKIVRFVGAYHGWWDDVQPGPGNPMPPGHVYTLQDMSERALRVIASRKDIACVLVNPLQALHPNQNAPGDQTLIDGSRHAGFDRAAYTTWLQQLRAVCTAAGVALIMDEVFVGFRLGVRGAQGYFNVDVDLVCYGKSLGGGLPVGVVCGKDEWMQRYKADKPADICFARGTFNAHPYVMGSMWAFLQRLDTPDIQRLYAQADARWDAQLALWNQRLVVEGLPLRVHGLQSIWTLTYTVPSRYHWMLQFYLREQGLALSWVGTGRFIFSLNYTDAQLAEVLERVVRAAKQMQTDGWWWAPPGVSGREMRRSVLKEMLQVRVAALLARWR